MLCRVTSRACTERRLGRQCLVLGGSSSGWGWGVSLARRESCCALVLQYLLLFAPRSPGQDVLPVPDSAADLGLSLTLFLLLDLMQACKYGKYKTSLVGCGSQLSLRVENKQKVTFSHL